MFSHNFNSRIATRWNAKGRCGKDYIGDDKVTVPAECDPDSRYHCCRLGYDFEESYCGVSEQHFCNCDTCVDYRRKNYTRGSAEFSLY